MVRAASVCRAIVGVGWVSLVLGGLGCSLPHGSIDVRAVVAARHGLEDYRVRDDSERYPADDDGDIDDGSAEKKPRKSVILGSLLSFFPGLLVPGVGHYYAGDAKTGRRLLRVGEIGWVLTAVGGGLVVGGVAASDNDLDGVAVGLYVAGGTAGGIGLTYLLSAWFYDMWDTPRAVRSGGRPPPRTPFVDSLDIFD